MSDLLPEHLALQLLPGECTGIQYTFIFVKIARVWDALCQPMWLGRRNWSPPSPETCHHSLSQCVMGCQCHHGTRMFLCGSIRRNNLLLSSSVPILQNILGCCQKSICCLPLDFLLSLQWWIMEQCLFKVSLSWHKWSCALTPCPKNHIRYLLVCIQE